MTDEHTKSAVDFERVKLLLEVVSLAAQHGAGLSALVGTISAELKAINEDAQKELDEAAKVEAEAKAKAKAEEDAKAEEAKAKEAKAKEAQQAPPHPSTPTQPKVS